MTFKRLKSIFLPWGKNFVKNETEICFSARYRLTIRWLFIIMDCLLLFENFFSVLRLVNNIYAMHFGKNTTIHLELNCWKGKWRDRCSWMLWIIDTSLVEHVDISECGLEWWWHSKRWLIKNWCTTGWHLS